MIQEVRISTLEDLMPLLSEQEYRPELGRNRSGYLYRGMPDSSYRMVTSLSRCCKGLQKTTDGLYFEISRHAIDMAMRLKALLREKGCTFFLDSPTNQQFIVLENSRLEEFGKHVAYDPWDRVDASHTAIRLATSWATPPAHLEELSRWL